MDELTIVALRTAANAIPSVPERLTADQEWRDYNEDLAAFWRLAYYWIEFTTRCGMYADIDEGMQIISEVEART